MNRAERLNYRKSQIVTNSHDREMTQAEIINIMLKLSAHNLDLLKSFAMGLSKNGYQSL